MNKKQAVQEFKENILPFIQMSKGTRLEKITLDK